MIEIPVLPSLEPFNHPNSRVLFRFDGNVPIERGKVLNDFKLRTILPTLDFLLHRNCKILLLTHLGRPERITKQYSTRPLLEWFKSRGYQIAYATTSERVDLLFKLGQRVILFENSRFFERDRHTRVDFIKSLVASTDCYVTDAFATLHAHDYSVILAPRLYPATGRYCGFLMQKELEAMKQLLQTKSNKILCILGGTKLETKLHYISKLVSATAALCFMPTYSFSFMYALGYPIGMSHKEAHLGPQLLTFLMLSNILKNSNIFLPKEYLIVDQGALDEPFINRTSNAFLPSDFGVTIASSCIPGITDQMKRAELIFINGAPGFLSHPKSFEPFHKLLQISYELNKPCIVAGGDTVAAMETSGKIYPNVFASTGGSSALAFASRSSLPGIDALSTTPLTQIMPNGSQEW